MRTTSLFLTTSRPLIPQGSRLILNLRIAAAEREGCCIPSKHFPNACMELGAIFSYRASTNDLRMTIPRDWETRISWTRGGRTGLMIRDIRPQNAYRYTLPSFSVFCLNIWVMKDYLMCYGRIVELELIRDPLFFNSLISQGYATIKSLQKSMRTLYLSLICPTLTKMAFP